jgi:hypothetical protein
MRAAPIARDHTHVRETLKPVSLTLTSMAVPVPLIGQPRRLLIREEAADPDPDLAWQASIGQFIYLQSLAEERL